MTVANGLSGNKSGNTGSKSMKMVGMGPENDAILITFIAMAMIMQTTALEEDTVAMDVTAKDAIIQPPTTSRRIISRSTIS
jgi:hypothetical protein